MTISREDSARIYSILDKSGVFSGIARMTSMMQEKTNWPYLLILD